MFAIKDISSVKIYNKYGDFIKDFDFFNDVNITEDNLVILNSDIMNPEFLELYHNGEISSHSFDKDNKGIKCEISFGKMMMAHYKFIIKLTAINTVGETKDIKLSCDDFMFGVRNDDIVTSGKKMFMSSDAITNFTHYMTCMGDIKMTIFE